MYVCNVRTSQCNRNLIRKKKASEKKVKSTSPPPPLLLKSKIFLVHMYHNNVYTCTHNMKGTIPLMWHLKKISPVKIETRQPGMILDQWRWNKKEIRDEWLPTFLAGILYIFVCIVYVLLTRFWWYGVYYQWIKVQMIYFWESLYLIWSPRWNLHHKHFNR